MKVSKAIPPCRHGALPTTNPNTCSKGTNHQHGALHSCVSAKPVSKNRHFRPNWIRRQLQARTSSMVGIHSCASPQLVSKTRHFNHTGLEVTSGTDMQHSAVHSRASAKLVSKNRHFRPNWIRGLFQARISSIVPFIPAPVPSWCRRLDTSTQAGSGGNLRNEPPAWCRSFLCQCHAGVEESTLQPKLDPVIISGTDIQHGAVHSCASAKLVSKNRHFNPNWIR